MEGIQNIDETALNVMVNGWPTQIVKLITLKGNRVDLSAPEAN